MSASNARQPSAPLKLWTIARLLRLRARHEALLREGGYTALRATGEHERHVVTFERSQGGRALIVVVARWMARLLAGQRLLPIGAAVWSDTRLELPQTAVGRTLRNVLTGDIALVEDGSVALADVFSTLPFAVLEIEAGRGAGLDPWVTSEPVDWSANGSSLQGIRLRGQTIRRTPGKRTMKPASR